MTDEELNRWIDKNVMGGPGEDVPYCSDLNFVAKAEAKVKDSYLFTAYLIRAVGIDKIWAHLTDDDERRLVVCAPARPRAEAIAKEAGLENDDGRSGNGGGERGGGFGTLSKERIGRRL